MLNLHPFIRLFTGATFVLMIFLTSSLEGILLIYAIVLFLVFLCKVGSNHFKFIFYVSSPLLAAMLVMWGFVIDHNTLPFPFENGFWYATFSWMRIVAWGGVLQFMLLPLVQSPTHLKYFFEKIRINSSVSTLLIAAIIFLPEMRRRLNQISDARLAQCQPIRGINGLFQLPALLMPLISSLLDSASKRAELWSHRGVFETTKAFSEEIVFCKFQNALFFASALGAIFIVVLI